MCRGTRHVDVWIPVASSNDRQDITQLNEHELKDGRFTVDRQAENRMYYRRSTGPFDVTTGDTKATTVNGERDPLQIRLTYDVVVSEATASAAKELISTRQIKPPADLGPYLTETSMIPIKGWITQIARGINLPDGEPLQAGRRIYEYLLDTMEYHYLAKGAGTEDAVWACDSKTGDCTDYHSVLIGACRWGGIQADHVFGMPIPPDKSEGAIRYCHCWARFGVADIGWIPIDASRADKYPEDVDYYFGTIGSTWVTLSHGRDVILDRPQKNAPVNMFHEPITEADGKPLHVHWSGNYRNHEPTADRSATAN